VKRVLITGMSGTGKSSVLSALRELGFKTVDTDYGGWSEQADVPGSGETAAKEWLWREDLMARLLATEDADVLFVSGAARNQTKFYRQFDHVVLLIAPVAVITERLAMRTNNPYGKDPAELAEVLFLKETVEPALRRGADLAIDTTIPLDEVVEKIVTFCRAR
jgi:shikimate kinase